MLSPFVGEGGGSEPRREGAATNEQNTREETACKVKPSHAVDLFFFEACQLEGE